MGSLFRTYLFSILALLAAAPRASALSNYTCRDGSTVVVNQSGSIRVVGTETACTWVVGTSSGRARVAFEGISGDPGLTWTGVRSEGVKPHNPREHSFDAFSRDYNHLYAVVYDGLLTLPARQIFRALGYWTRNMSQFPLGELTSTGSYLTLTFRSEPSSYPGAASPLAGCDVRMAPSSGHARLSIVA